VKKQGTKEEMEKRHAAGYACIPSRPEEFEEWESEQAWPECKEVEHEIAIQQAATTGKERRVLREASERAAEIRHSLEGRHHSDRTQVVIEDRQR
jgi:hypothetical protein